MLFFVMLARQANPVPLYFGPDQVKALRALRKYKEKGNVFRMMREAGIASTFFTRFAMIAAAIEGMAGEIQSHKGGRKQTNKEYIKTHIVRDQKLYKALFSYGDSARNKIIHGKRFRRNDRNISEEDAIQRTYVQILEYFEREHGVSINKKIVRPMRTKLGNYEYTNLWLRDTMNSPIFLKDLNRQFEENKRSMLESNKILGRFEKLDSSPKDF